MSVTTIHPNSPSDLFAAASALDDARFDRLLDELLRVRAGRRAPKVGTSEADLLDRINTGPPPDVWSKYRELQARHANRTLTLDDQAELIRLTDVMEQYQAARVVALSDLAALRGLALGQLVDDLGISGPPSE